MTTVHGLTSCENCGLETPPEAAFCPECGHRIKGFEAPRQSDESNLSVVETLQRTSMEEAIQGLARSNDVVGRRFGRYTCAQGWFLKRKLLGGFDGFRATDVCWVYAKKTTHSVNFVPINATWGITAHLRSGKTIGMNAGESTGTREKLAPANTDFEVRRLARILPWALVGFSPYIKECWEKNPTLFLQVIDRRIAAVGAWISDGTMVVQPDGTLTTSPTTKLPTISMGFEGAGRKKKRVYSMEIGHST